MAEDEGGGMASSLTRKLYALFGIILMMITGGAYTTFEYITDRLVASEQDKLQRFANIKIDDIDSMISERHGDAEVFVKRPEVWNYLIDSSLHASERQHLDQAIYITIKGYRYQRILLFDADLNVVAPTGPAELVPAELHAVATAIRRRDSALVDIHHRQDGTVAWGYAHAVFAYGNAGGEVIGAVYMERSGQDDIFPLLERRFSDSQSGETLLAHRDGDFIAYLNALRFIPGSSPLSVRLPISGIKTHANLALVNGKVGLVSGIDYRGVEVIGSAHLVRNTPWAIITKIDREEIEAPAKIIAVIICAFVFFLFFIAFIAFSYYLRWRSREIAIDEHRINEETLKSNQSLISAMLNASHDAIMLIRADGTILSVNNVMAERFSRTPEQLEGTSLWELFPEEVSELRRQATRTVVETGVPAHTQDRRGDLFFDNSIYPVFNSDGVVDKLAVYSRDITERIVSETKLSEYLEEIEEAKADLERSNVELEQFAYVASHDLREPLRMVSSYLSLLERRYENLLDADGHEFIGFARDGAKRMDQIVLDLLELSRIGTRGDPITAMPVLPAIQLALTNLGMTSDDCGATLTVDDALSSSWVMGDPIQIMRLFQNLIGNGIKYRNLDVAPTIHIGGQSLGEYWEFSVADNGIGIAPEYFERIFGIFQRLHTHEQFEGTGIGLAVCMKIVERHGGKIWLESRPGDGTTFFFTLRDASPAAT
jgi:PAS domain S-box-containing protein